MPSRFDPFELGFFIHLRSGKNDAEAWLSSREAEIDANHERDRVGTINTAAFQKARSDVGLAQVRVHDLRHTFGQRLRDAGVREEDRHCCQASH